MVSDEELKKVLSLIDRAGQKAKSTNDFINEGISILRALLDREREEWEAEEEAHIQETLEGMAVASVIKGTVAQPDDHIETPPPLESGTMRVKLRYAGEAKPTAVDDEPDDLNDALVQAYKKGYGDGLWAYAWMKDGESYVGSGILTYNEAVKKFNKEKINKETLLAAVRAALEDTP
jgi:hypothetical protein